MKSLSQDSWKVGMWIDLEIGLPGPGEPEPRHLSFTSDWDTPGPEKPEPRDLARAESSKATDTPGPVKPGFSPQKSGLYPEMPSRTTDIICHSSWLCRVLLLFFFWAAAEEGKLERGSCPPQGFEIIWKLIGTFWPCERAHWNAELCYQLKCLVQQSGKRDPIM